MKSVCVLLYAPRPSRPPASPVLQQNARSAFLYARLFLHHTLPLCRTSNDHSTPRGALKFPPPHFSPSTRSARGRTTSACLREGGVRGPLCPSVSGSYWPVTPSSTYYSVQGEKKKKSRGKTREREREVRKTFSWISDALLFVPDCPTDTCNQFYPPMFTL